MNSRTHLFRALTVGWMLLIFFLSSQPLLPTPRLFSGEDFLAHAAFYAVLCVFLALSIESTRPMPWKRVFVLTLLVTAYGITDEYHQSFVPGRAASVWDALADGVGGFLTALMFFWRDRKTAEISQPILPVERKRA